jgi:hypothetical protein
MLATSASVASRGADAYTNTRVLTSGVLGLQVPPWQSLSHQARWAKHACRRSWRRPKPSNEQYTSQVFDEIYVRDSISWTPSWPLRMCRRACVWRRSQASNWTEDNQVRRNKNLGGNLQKRSLPTAEWPKCSCGATWWPRIHDLQVCDQSAYLRQLCVPNWQFTKKKSADRWVTKVLQIAQSCTISQRFVKMEVISSWNASLWNLSGEPLCFMMSCSC